MPSTPPPPPPDGYSQQPPTQQSGSPHGFQRPPGQPIHEQESAPPPPYDYRPPQSPPPPVGNIPSPPLAHQYRQYPDHQLYHEISQPAKDKKGFPRWVWFIGGLIVLLIVGALISEADDDAGADEEVAAVDDGDDDGEGTETTGLDPPTTQTPTTQSTTTTTTDLDTETANLVCDSFTEFLDENPDARVIEAIALGAAWRDALIDKGYDPSKIGRKVASECRNGYNNEALMAYGGFGPLVDAVDYTLDRGTCGPRGDYGGVLTMSGAEGGKYSVELELTYVAAGVVEHETSEYVDVERGGNGVAFKFFFPSVPSGGECEVRLVSVQPE